MKRASNWSWLPMPTASRSATPFAMMKSSHQEEHVQLRLIATRSLALAAFGLIALFLASCGGGDSGPDLIYYNGVVLTMDGENSEALH